MGSDLVRVQLSEGARKAKGHEPLTSTFFFENKRYFLQVAHPVVVERSVANAWKTADSNVSIMPER